MDHLCYFCLVLLCFHARLFVDALRSPAGKGLTSWLSFVMSNCDVTLSLSHWYPGQVWCLIVSIPDLCPLSYYYQQHECAPFEISDQIGYRPSLTSVFAVHSMGNCMYIGIRNGEDSNQTELITRLT